MSKLNTRFNMDKLIARFEKIASNPYLRAIRDGFISLIPVVLFSSIFLLIAFVPNIWGQNLPDAAVASLMKAYSYSMGILGLLIAGTVARSLTTTFNSKLPATRQINVTSVMAASTIGFLLIGISTTADGSGFSMEYLGTKGLLAAFLVAFITTNIYKFCVARNIRIKMPEQVPQNISQTFADLIPMALTIIFFWVFDLLFRHYISPEGFTATLISVFQPIFRAADSYLGLALIFGGMAFFWFIGIHGPSIVEPAVAAIYLSNVATNFELFKAGEHASHVLSQGTQYFVATLGGTGANLVITYMMATIAKSKQLRSVGRASLVPVTFGINEPVLFGVPFVLNPIFMMPFIFTPIINVWLLKFFIDLGMNGFIYNLPWTTPGPLGLIMGTGFAPLSFVLFPLILAVDFFIYLPFMRVYDKQLLAKEALGGTDVPAEKTAKTTTTVEIISPDGAKSVLVICANGATSSMLANAIKNGAKALNMELESVAMAYGQHREVMSSFDLVILAPQMASMLEEIAEEGKNCDTLVVSLGGPEYIKYTRNPEDALRFALKHINDK